MGNHFHTFKSASSTAREIARDTMNVVVVQREGDGWRVRFTDGRVPSVLDVWEDPDLVEDNYVHNVLMADYYEEKRREDKSTTGLAP